MSPNLDPRAVLSTVVTLLNITRFGVSSTLTAPSVPPPPPPCDLSPTTSQVAADGGPANYPDLVPVEERSPTTAATTNTFEAMSSVDSPTAQPPHRLTAADLESVFLLVVLISTICLLYFFPADPPFEVVEEEPS